MRFFKPISTRHTKAGTFRAGIVYSVDEEAASAALRAAIKPHLKSKVFAEIAADAAEGMTNIVALGPQASDGGAQVDDEAGDDDTSPAPEDAPGDASRPRGKK